MPLVGSPTFAPGILTADQLNSLVTILEQKFDGGIGTDDISWPLSAGGNIDMVQHDILHLYKLWNVRNLAERDSATTVQDVFDEVAGEGGGVILLPANNTETLGTEGVEVGPNTLVMGQGRSSVFATTGTLTNHMFRNAANDDSGIKFVNCKLTNEGAAGGAFDIIGFSRVSACQLVDVYLVVDRENGVSFETNSSGDTNTDNRIIRGQIDVQDGGDAGVYATDVKGLRIEGVKFNLSAGTALTYAANGAASFGQSIRFSGNEVLVDDASTSTKVVLLTAGSTNGLDKLRVESNDIECGLCDLDVVIDVVGVAAGHGPVISHNDIVGEEVTGAAIRLQNSVGAVVEDNDVNVFGVTNGGIGILIGGTARGGSAAGCKNFVCSDNRVKSGGSSYVFVHPGSGNTFESSVISANVGTGNTATEAEFEIWNLGSATTTTRAFSLVIDGNSADPASPTTIGWQNYSDMGSTQGGSAGIAHPSYLTVTSNVIVGSDFSDSGGDFANTQTGASPDFYAHGQNIT